MNPVPARTVVVDWKERTLRYKTGNDDVVSVCFPIRRRDATDLFRYVCSIAIAQDTLTRHLRPTTWTGCSDEYLTRVVAKFRWKLEPSSRMVYWSYFPQGSTRHGKVFARVQRADAMGSDLGGTAWELFPRRMTGYLLGRPDQAGGGQQCPWAIEFLVDESVRADYQAFRADVCELLDSTTLSAGRNAHSHPETAHAATVHDEGASSIPCPSELFAEIFSESEFFGGRHAEMACLGEFLKKTKRGYFFVTGPSGFGKTAVLSRLAQDLEQNGTRSAVHFIRRQDRDDSRRFCLRNIGRQIEASHGIPHGAPDDDWDLDPYFRGLLLRRPQPGQRIVVILDGLDEAVPSWTPDATIFPANLPDGIHVVLSAREVANKDWLEDLGLTLPPNRVLQLGRLCREGIQDVVSRSDLGRGGSRSLEEIVERLWILSEGDPFYLHDLLLKLKKPGGDIESLSEYQIGFSKYLGQWWKDGYQALHGQASGSRTFGGLMALLAVARARIGRDMLIELGTSDGVTGSSYRSVMDHAARFMVGDENGGYALSHGRIVEFVEHEMQHELDGYRSRFADYCSRWNGLSPGVGRDYALRFGAAHLADAGQHEKLRELLFEFEWLRAKLEATDGHALVSDFSHVPSNREVACLRDAFRASSHVLARDTTQLAGQLIGRLLDDKSPRIQATLSQARQSMAGPWLCPMSSTLSSMADRVLLTLSGHSGTVWALAVSPNSRLIVSGSEDRTLKVWELSTGRCLHTLQGHEGFISAVAVTPDGRAIVSASEDKTLRIWSLDTGQMLHVLERHTGVVSAVAVTHDTRQVVSTSWDNTVRLWSVDTGEPGPVLHGHTDAVDAVAVAPDGQIAVTASHDGTLRVWDLVTGVALRATQVDPEYFCPVQITPDGRKVICAGRDKTLKLVDIDTGNVLNTSQRHDDLISGVALMSDGRCAISASPDGTLRLWEPEGGPESCTLARDTNGLTAMAVAPDGSFLVAGRPDGTIKVWDPEVTQRIEEKPANEGPVADLIVTPDTRWAISCTCDGALSIWSVESGQLVHTANADSDSVGSSVVTPDGRWSLHPDPLHAPRVTDNNSGHIVAMVNVRSRRPDDRRIRIYLALGEDRWIVAGHRDSIPEIWDSQDRQKQYTLDGDPSWITCMSLHPDGRRLVSGAINGTLTLWDLDKRCTVRTMSANAMCIHGVAVMPDGRRVLSVGDDMSVRLWDVDSGELTAVLEGHESWIEAVAVAPDGRLGCTGSHDGTVIVWDLEESRALTRFICESAVLAVAITANGRMILAGEESGRVHFLRLDGADGTSRESR